MQYLNAFALVAILATHCLAQSAADTNAYLQSLRAQQEAVAADNSHWEAARKLTHPDVQAIRESREERLDSLPILSLDKDHKGRLDQYKMDVLQVIDDRNLLLSVTYKDSPLLWLEDFPTEGLADKTKIRIAGPVVVTGTKQYTAVSGSTRTVHAIRFLDAKEAKEILAKEMAEKKEREAFHEFVSGDKRVKAKLLDYRSGTAFLEDENGNELRVRLRQMSKEDQAWVREAAKQLDKK